MVTSAAASPNGWRRPLWPDGPGAGRGRRRDEHGVDDVHDAVGHRDIGHLNHAIFDGHERTSPGQGQIRALDGLDRSVLDFGGRHFAGHHVESQHRTEHLLVAGQLGHGCRRHGLEGCVARREHRERPRAAQGVGQPGFTQQAGQRGKLRCARRRVGDGGRCRCGRAADEEGGQRKCASRLQEGSLVHFGQTPGRIGKRTQGYGCFVTFA